MNHRSKKALLLVLAAVCVILTLTLVACNATTIQKVKFKVTFEVDGVSYYEINTQGTEVLQMPDDPTKDGYIFDGWYWDKDAWTRPFTANSLSDEALSADMRVYAKWKEDIQNTPIRGTGLRAKTLTVDGTNLYTKVSNATETFSFINEISVADGAKFTVHTDISCSGASELRSKTASLENGDNVIYILVSYGNDVELYTATIRRRQIYRVTFYTNGGASVPTQYVEEDDFAEEPITTRRGYTFDSWNYDFSKPIVGNITITASWNIITYNIYYDLNDANLLYSAVNSESNPTTYTVEDYIWFRSPTCAGYEFNGWDTFSINNNIGDITVTAKPWSIESYRINYNYDIASNSVSKTVANDNPTTYTVEDEIIFEPAMRSGYEFVAWDRNITKGTYGDITIKASWEAIKYNINYVLNGGNNSRANVDTYTVEDGKIWFYNATGNYLFCGWYEDDSYEIYCDGILSIEMRDITLYALFDGTKGLEISNGVVTGYTGNSEAVILPSKYKGFPVIRIGDYAFDGCSEITDISFPVSFNNEQNLNSVVEMQNDSNYPFSYENGVLKSTNKVHNSKSTYTIIALRPTTITFKYKVSSEGYDYLTIYKNTSQLEKISGNTNYVECSVVLRRGEYVAFEYRKDSSISSRDDCAYIQIVSISCSPVIGSYAFRGCSGLTNVVIPDSVTYIGLGAFEGCSSLIEMSIPFVGDSMKTSSDANQYPFGYIFGTNNYEGGMETKQSYYGSSTSTITNTTYYIPTSLKKVTVRYGNILYGAFNNCSNLTSVTIGNSVKGIGYYAFYGCSGLTKVTIPDSVTSIGESAFRGCSGLTSVTIPDSVTSIGEYAFSGCGGLTNVTIGNSVTSIGGYAFYGCSRLTSVIISDSVTRIGSWAFFGCSVFRSVYYKGTATDWAKVYNATKEEYNLLSATKYYYSEEEPPLNDEGTDYDGNYWHYVDGVVTVWVKEN